MPLSKSTNFKTSLQQLRKRLKKDVVKQYESLFKELESLGHLLDGSVDVEQSAVNENIKEVLVAGMQDLYRGYPIMALKLASSFLYTAFRRHISPHINVAQENISDAVKRWVKITDLLLQGVLAYLDTGKIDQKALGVGFFPTGCVVLSMAIKERMPAAWVKHLCNIITDAAAGCKENITILRQKTWFGATKLGELISSTEEYLVLEALLELLPNILPSSLDPKLRHQFLDDLQRGLPNKLTIHADIRRILANVTSGSYWEKISESIIRCLAQSDIKFPQPIPIMSLEVQGVPLKHCDQMYAGKDSFIVNVPDKDGEIDTLQVFFSTVQSINTRVSLPSHCCEIALGVSTPPLLAGWEVKPETESPQTVNLKIGESYLPLFRTILSGRKVAHLLGIPTGSKARSSLSGTISCEKPMFPSAYKIVVSEAPNPSDLKKIDEAKETDSESSSPNFADMDNSTFASHLIDESANDPAPEYIASIASLSDSLASAPTTKEKLIPLTADFAATRLPSEESDRPKPTEIGKRKRVDPLQPTPAEEQPTEKKRRQGSLGNAESETVNDAASKDLKPKPTRTYGTRQKKHEVSQGLVIDLEAERPGKGTRVSKMKSMKESSAGTGLKSILKPGAGNIPQAKAADITSKITSPLPLGSNSPAEPMKKPAHAPPKRKRVRLPSISSISSLNDNECIEISGLVDDTVQHSEPEPRPVDAHLTPVSKPTVLHDIATNTVNSAHSSFKRAPPKSPETANDIQYLGMNVKGRMISSALPVSGLDSPSHTMNVPTDAKPRAAKPDIAQKRRDSVIGNLSQASRNNIPEIVVPSGLATIDLTQEETENKDQIGNDSIRTKISFSKFKRLEPIPVIQRGEVDTTLRVSPPPGYSPNPIFSNATPSTRPAHTVASSKHIIEPIGWEMTNEFNNLQSFDAVRCKENIIPDSQKLHAEKKVDSATEVIQAFNNITGIIVDNIRNKTRGLKLEARVGRDKILSDAHTDMELIRTGSANCYNQLLELKGAYDDQGLQMRKAWDELRDSNNRLIVRLHNLTHDSGTKNLGRMRTNLSTRLLPDSFRLDD